MNYNDFLKLRTFSKEQLISIAYGRLVDDPPGPIPFLPTPPMLMLDRVTAIEINGKKGFLTAEQDIHIDSWFFACHFRDDPVMPGCLGVDAVWQLLGIFCALSGSLGMGRALGCESVEFFGQIRPYNRLVRYEMEVHRFIKLQDRSLILASANVYVDDEHVYTIKNAKVGIFDNIQYGDYPKRSTLSLGGRLAKF